MAKNLAKVEWRHRGNVSAEYICENIRANAGRDRPALGFRRVCVCASGPSLADHVESIRVLQRDHGFDVAAMNGSYRYLLDRGIVADYYFQIDAREGVNLPFLDRLDEQTTFIIASQCHPEIFERLEDHDVRLWQVDNYEGAREAINASVSTPPTILGGSSNVGNSALLALFAMGYRSWYLFGYDASMRGVNKHAFDQPQNASEEVMEFTFAGNTYNATPTMAHCAEHFVDLFRTYRDLGVEIRLYSDGLLPDMVRINAGKHYMPEPGEQGKRVVPPARKRTKPVEKLPIVFWKWEGHIPYHAEDVNIMARQVDRFLDMPHEIVCITDKPEGIDGGVRIVPLWRDHFEHGYDWHRLRVFAPVMADIIGPRFVSMDLDTVICDRIDPLFADFQTPFKAWQDPNLPYQYCTAMFMMDAGAYPHVLADFDRDEAMRLRESNVYIGYDQLWISHVLPGQPMWTRHDGVLSFKNDVLGGNTLRPADLPNHARTVNFHGQFNPRDLQVQYACPWIMDYWK